MNQLICFVLSQISYACLFISRRPRLCMKSFLISHVAIHTLSRDWSDRALRKRSADRNVWTTLLSAFVPNITGVHEEMNYCKCCNKHTVVCIWTDFTYHRVDKCWRYGNTSRTFVCEQVSFHCIATRCVTVRIILLLYQLLWFQAFRNTFHLHYRDLLPFGLRGIKPY